MGIDELKKLLLKTDPDVFCKDHLFNDEMWFFDSGETEVKDVSYDDFRKTVSDHLGLQPDCIALTGSAKFGCSLNPNPKINKAFRAFHEGSDLDLIIVSPELFNEIWLALREAYFSGYWWIMRHHAPYIFRHFISLVSEERYKTKYLRETVRKLDSMAFRIVTTMGISRTINYRIYSDWNDVYAYHSYSIKEIQKGLSDDT